MRKLKATIQNLAIKVPFGFLKVSQQRTDFLLNNDP